MKNFLITASFALALCVTPSAQARTTRPEPPRIQVGSKNKPAKIKLDKYTLVRAKVKDDYAAAVAAQDAGTAVPAETFGNIAVMAIKCGDLSKIVDDCIARARRAAADNTEMLKIADRIAPVDMARATTVVSENMPAAIADLKDMQGSEAIEERIKLLDAYVDKYQTSHTSMVKALTALSAGDTATMLARANDAAGVYTRSGFIVTPQGRVLHDMILSLAVVSYEKSGADRRIYDLLRARNASDIVSNDFTYALTLARIAEELKDLNTADINFSRARELDPAAYDDYVARRKESAAAPAVPAADVDVPAAEAASAAESAAPASEADK